tara:strand:- start:244 stop:672 length:429 start_codon:yes stop_codon:yes gene_type:complete
VNKQRSVTTAVLQLLNRQLHDVAFDVCEKQKNNLQFRNCVFELDTQKARPRTKDDHVTQILDYDYSPDYSEEAKLFVETFFKQLQPDDEQRAFTVAFLAYCLSGRTDKQIAKYNIGYSAQNGKSTELKIQSTKTRDRGGVQA